VLADGKIYVGSENGKFFILKPGQEKVEILDSDQLADQEQIIASPAIANGRVYFVSTDAIYCIGTKRNVTPTPKTVFNNKAPAGATVAHVQVVPAEVVLKPGDKAQFRVLTYDATGRLIGPATGTEWSLGNLRGTAGETFTAPADVPMQAGVVIATVGNVKGQARVRVLPSAPWQENFDALAPGPAPATWVNATGKFTVRQVDDNKVLVKLADNPFTKRARIYVGPTDMRDYTVEADFRAIEKRRQLGDAGVVAQRYNLILFGSHQRLELESWQPETKRTVSAPFEWKGDTWYHLKLRVEPSGNKVIAHGKVWAKDQPEPDKWMVERTDEYPEFQGSPGVYADAPFEVFFDNLKVTPNR
jgi:hypothetical protein